jgi:hypothetical protein
MAGVQRPVRPRLLQLRPIASSVVIGRLGARSTLASPFREVGIGALALDLAHAFGSVAFVHAFFEAAHGRTEIFADGAQFLAPNTTNTTSRMTISSRIPIPMTTSGYAGYSRAIARMDRP